MTPPGTLPPAPDGAGGRRPERPRVPPESARWAPGADVDELEVERIAGHFPRGYLNLDAARLAAAYGLGALQRDQRTKGPMSYTDRIRAGEVDPLVGTDVDGARRSVDVINDELSTLDRDDPRRALLLDQRAAWEARAHG